jgi:ABC-type branched-subunit amino acid transport system permease subunit
MNETKVEQMLRAAGACVIALGLLLVPVLFPSFLVYQFSLTLTYAIAILGLNLLMGFNGQISVAHGVFFALKLEPITKGATGISLAKPAPPAWLPGDQDTFIYFVCLAGVAVCVLLAWRLMRGDTGRSLRAARDNGLIAESLGINLSKVRIMAFTTSAGFAGFGGGLFAIVNAYVSPESFQMTKSFDFLVASIVGGITSISGAFIGALFIVFLPDWSADMNIALSGLIYGGVMVGMMLVARDGVVGLLGTLTRAAIRRLLTAPRSGKSLSAQTDEQPDGRQYQT